MSDEVLAEVRKIRHEISRRCENDPHRVVAYYREFQEQLKRSGNYRFAEKSPAHKAENDHVSVTP